MALRVIAALTLAFLLAFAPAHAETKATVDTIMGQWTDAARAGRVVPYKIYYPTNVQGARPVVIFSHGLGGNREGAEYLLRFLAENGYVAVGVQHAGSDTPAVFGGMPGESGFDPSKAQEGARAAMAPGVAVDRFRDIPFTITELEQMNAGDAKLRGRLNMSRIGMSGHSYGAVTTLALAGQSLGPRGQFSFADQRITAAIAYSPNKPRQGDPAEVYKSIRIPIFHMTGTEDKSPLDGSEDPVNRQIPYRNTTGADKYLLVFNGGDHMIFSGRTLRSGPRPNDDKFHALIQKASLAYWDAYLMGNKEAKAYLTGGQFQRDLGGDGEFEFQLR
jgi:predicted dienelactone hydrolase